ncbi:methionine synthase [Aureococcus anophagefferens]|nr:methionine synthase [Aureococcus anophagefferens]
MVKRVERVVFDWEKNYESKPQTEPPLPMTKVSRDHVPNPREAAEPGGVAVRRPADELGPAEGHAPEGFRAVRRDGVRSYITELFQTRITMYDGAMGTMIQKHKLDEPDFRAERFKDYDMLIKGNNDLLSITQPHIIRDIYKKYLVEGGSQLIGTNTFSSTTIAQADYKMEDLVYELNYDSARGVRRGDGDGPAKPRFVCGAIGPTNRTASISPDVNDPTTRNCDFDELVEAYYEQSSARADGGCDIFIIETIFDTLNAKAACFAVNEFLEHTGIDIPLFISGTLVDQSGRAVGPGGRGVLRVDPPREAHDFKFDETTYNHTGLPFVNVGERCNIAGSRKFKRLIMEGKYPELMDIAKDQVEAGAHVVDINVDDGMLDGLAAMQKFVKMAVTEPDVAKAPFMIDSSKFDIVEAGLKWCQGKCIVNSISLKAATKEDKVRICKRSYDILVNEPVCFPPEDIIFDPNILTIGTGIEEHNARHRLHHAVRQIKEICPWCKISGGVSNLSFGFRGVNQIRESIHAVFLYHAARLSGMDMGIVNAAEMFAYEKVSDDLLEICEDAVLNRTKTATEDLTEWSQWFFDCKSAKKNGEPMPDKPRRRPKKQPRYVFDWEKNYVAKPQTEPPLPMTKFDDLRASWAQPKDTHPEGFPYAAARARSYITELFQRITMYDGAMGTMIQKHKLDEPDFRAERFKDYDMLIKGNNDLLSITQPHHPRHLQEADYKMEDLVYELNYDSASRRVRRGDGDGPDEARFVCGAIGPTNRTASISPDVNDPTTRNCDFDELVEAYYEQCVGLADGGCDIFIIETIFDTLNAKAACFAVNEFLEHTGIDIPLFISGTLVDQSGRTLSGQTGEAFYVSIRHAKPMCVGLNCALGAKAMAPFLKRLSDCAECFVHVYSTRASRAMGGYDDTPADMAGRTSSSRRAAG